MKKKSPMTPGEIRQALDEAGYSQAMVAEDCEVSRSLVSQVVRSKATSHRIRTYIAEKIKKPVEEVFLIPRNPHKPGPKRL
jgi:predicted XRE-type DNA-binding protein